MTGISTLAQALGQIDRIQDQQLLLDTLSTQLATGKKTQKFSGLEGDILQSKRARADLSSLDTYINNIKIAENRAQLSLATIAEFQQQAENFADALAGFTQESAHQQGEVVYYDDPLTPNDIENVQIGHNSAAPDVDFETLQDLASDLYDFMTDLMNTKDGDRYMFSGADTSTRPLVDDGVLDSALATQVNDWKLGIINNADLIADLTDRTIDNGNLDALTDTVIGYSATLSADTAGRVFTRVDENTEIDTTIYANDIAFRDIIVALSYIKNPDLGPIVDEVEIDAVTGLPTVITEGAPGADIDEMTDNFYEVFNVITSMVTQALDQVDQQRFKLENARARINEIKLNHETEQSILQETVDEIENVDINEVAVKINALQLQLEASYGVTARVQQLSLVNFI